MWTEEVVIADRRRSTLVVAAVTCGNESRRDFWPSATEYTFISSVPVIEVTTNANRIASVSMPTSREVVPGWEVDSLMRVDCVPEFSSIYLVVPAVFFLIYCSSSSLDIS